MYDNLGFHLAEEAHPLDLNSDLHSNDLFGAGTLWPLMGLLDHSHQDANVPGQGS